MLLIGTAFSTSGNISLKHNSNFSSEGNTLYVGGSGPGNYTKIQDAIDNASDGDTIFVYNGTYGIDHNTISINKSINLIGESKTNTIINGSGIYLEISKVLITGFTLQNSIGLTATYSNNNKFFNNIIKTRNYHGISLYYSNNNNISNNCFIGCGLMLWGYNNKVENNTVNNKPLIYLENKSNIVVEHGGQVILIKCKKVTIKNLELTDIDLPIQLFECTNCSIIDNKFLNNSFAGIHLGNSTGNTISGNIFKNINTGLSLIFSCKNNISGNHFENELINIVMQSSSCNYFSKNNFINFNFYIKLKSIISVDSNNKWRENYWNRSRYFPTIIWGFKLTWFFRGFIRPCIDIDWHPAKEPYDIIVQ